MTRVELLNYLTEEAKKYHEEALPSLERNDHMNDLSQSDFKKLKKNQELSQKLIDALLVDFINYVGMGQCIDYGLHTKHIK